MSSDQLKNTTKGMILLLLCLVNVILLRSAYIKGRGYWLLLITLPLLLMTWYNFRHRKH